MEGRAMMAVAHPKLALRPFLPADAPLLREIFRDSIEELTSDDYTEAQQEAWASVADDVREFREQTFRTTDAWSRRWKARRSDSRRWKARTRSTCSTSIRPQRGRASGAMLIDALEKLAGARGTAKLTVDASDSARGFFEKRGYIAQQRNTISIGDEWLANTTLQKQLAAKREAS